MAEPEKKQTQTAPKPEDQKSEEAAALSRKRRVALVTYLSILFAVAFLLVALSMVIENRHLQTSNAALKTSSQRNSANLSQTIQEMQNENDALKAQAEALQGEKDQLQASLDQVTAEKTELETGLEQAQADAARQKTELDAEIAALTVDRDALAAQKTELETSLQARTEEAAAASKRAEDAVQVSEYLQKAIAADEKGELKTVKKYLEKIEPMKDLLSPSELEWYEHLAID